MKPVIFQEADLHSPGGVVDSNYLQSLLFPKKITSILQWLCQGDNFTQSLSLGQAEMFADICRTNYNFEPDVKNVNAIAELLGAQRASWREVWQHYANAPQKYPQIAGLLRMAKPADLNTGMFAYPEESWPQVKFPAFLLIRKMG